MKIYKRSDSSYYWVDYVDYTGKMKKDDIIEMLKTRAQRKEMTFEEYERILDIASNAACQNMKLEANSPDDIPRSQ